MVTLDLAKQVALPRLIALVIYQVLHFDQIFTTTEGKTLGDGDIVVLF